MTTKRSTRRTALSLLVVGGYLLGSGTCVTRDGAADFAESTASRLASLFVDALVINPLQDALTPPTETQ